MTQSVSKPAIAALSTVLALVAAVGIVALLRSGGGGSVKVVDTIDEMQRYLADSRGAGLGTAVEARETGLPPLVHLKKLPPEVLKTFFPSAGTKSGQADDLAYVRRASDFRWRVTWPEHPSGGWENVTNAVGLKHPTDLDEVKAGARILVTGDSHIEGVVPFEETLPQQLGSLVEQGLPGIEVEGINAAMGGYTIYNYLGVLERDARLDPDVFVVVVYGGNDFDLLARMERYFNGRGPFKTKKFGAGKALDAWNDTGPVRSQECTQWWYFQANPGDEAVAATASAAILAEIRVRCELRGIQPVFAYLPPPLVTQPERFPVELGKLAVAFEFEDDPAAFDHLVHTSDRIADRMLAECAAAGVECLDLRVPFGASTELLYWRKDYHTNSAGLRLVAEQLLPAVRKALATESR